MASRPSVKLAELLERAPTEDRQAITAWLLDGRSSPPAANAEDYWTPPSPPAGAIIRDVSPVESPVVTVRLPSDVHAELRDWCGARGYSIAAVICGLAERFVLEQRAAGTTGSS